MAEGRYPFLWELSAEQGLIDDEEGRALNMRIQEAINRLTSRQKEAIFLRYYECASYEEIAGKMNISVKASYKIIGRAVSSLRDSWAELFNSVRITFLLFFV